MTTLEDDHTRLVIHIALLSLKGGTKTQCSHQLQKDYSNPHSLEASFTHCMVVRLDSKSGYGLDPDY